MIEEYFNAVFKTTPAITNKTAGRVNLMGEHTDYNGGMALPTALPLGLTVALRPRRDRTIRIVSKKFDGIIETDLSTNHHDGWAGHAVGSIVYANREGLIDCGADLAIDATVPDGAGLSSSAALVVSIIKAARDLNKSLLSDQEVAVLARRVENEFVGVPCGIMDQMAVALTHQGQALALDTKSLRYRHIALPADYHLAVVHSGQYRKLTDGRYAARKAECDRARDLLDVKDLCLLDDETLDRTMSLPQPFGKRARHCAIEHRRTRSAAIALEAGATERFGRLMVESHASMRDDFEMSLPEIDALVDSAISHGAVGARLTGGGFGGCIVACVRKEKLVDWRMRLQADHPQSYFVC